MTAHPARLTPKLSSSPKQPQPAAAFLQPDSATNSLDVLSRASLLAFLREESETRGCTVVFCTHIFDGLDGWATDCSGASTAEALVRVIAKFSNPGKAASPTARRTRCSRA